MEPRRAGESIYRLHRGDGPAMLFRDGWPVYAWHGVRVPGEAIEAPDSLTSERILAERNVEVRRALIEIYGHDRFLLGARAKKLHVDDWGTLWRVDLPDDQPLLMVEVLNSTPEPDGAFKTYHLRVPPDMRTAHQAVAWTFQMTEEEYQPAIQT